MQQQINLYQPIFRRQRKQYSARAMVQTVAVVCTGLAVAYGYGWWRVHGLQREVAMLSAQKAVAAHQLSAVQSAYSPRPKSVLLEQEIVRIERQLEATRTIADLLASGNVGTRQGFSARLAALARQHVPGTWLRSVRIEEGGRRIVIVGSALAPELVPELVQRLTAEAAFAGSGFEQLELTRPQDAPSQVDFVLRSHSADGRTPVSRDGIAGTP